MVRSTVNIANISICPVSWYLGWGYGGMGVQRMLSLGPSTGGRARRPQSKKERKMRLTSGNASLNRRCSMFHEWLRLAYDRFSASLVVTDPVVISSESIKDRSPVNLCHGTKQEHRRVSPVLVSQESCGSDKRCNRASTHAEVERSRTSWLRSMLDSTVAERANDLSQRNRSSGSVPMKHSQSLDGNRTSRSKSSCLAEIVRRG